MQPWIIVVLVIMVILIALMVVLVIYTNKMQKKSAAQQEDMRAAAQMTSMLVIDKKRMKLREANLPKIVLDQTPKYLRGSKVPIVKAKIGPKVLSLMCDEKLFDFIPVKQEIKALISGIYIMEVKGLRGGLAAPVKKQPFLQKVKSRFKKDK